MPSGGFNKKMLEGLTSFHEGSVEHGIIEKVRKKGVSYEEIFKREFEDLDRFLAETHAIDNPIRRELVENLIGYARAFYQLIEQRGVENFQKVGGDLTKFFDDMDRKYHSELEGHPNAMRLLVDYLNKLE